MCPHRDVSWRHHRHITAAQEMCSLSVDLSNPKTSQSRVPITLLPETGDRGAPTSAKPGVLEVQREVSQGRPAGPSTRDQAKRGP